MSMTETVEGLCAGCAKPVAYVDGTWVANDGAECAAHPDGHFISARYLIAKDVLANGVYHKMGNYPFGDFTKGIFKKIDGAILDAMTAGALVAVFEALSPKSQVKFDSIPIVKLVNFCWSKVKIG